MTSWNPKQWTPIPNAAVVATVCNLVLIVNALMISSFTASSVQLMGISTSQNIGRPDDPWDSVKSPARAFLNSVHTAFITPAVCNCLGKCNSLISESLYLPDHRLKPLDCWGGTSKKWKHPSAQISWWRWISLPSPFPPFLYSLPNSVPKRKGTASLKLVSSLMIGRRALFISPTILFLWWWSRWTFVLPIRVMPNLISFWSWMSHWVSRPWPWTSRTQCHPRRVLPCHPWWCRLCRTSTRDFTYCSGVNSAGHHALIELVTSRLCCCHGRYFSQVFYLLTFAGRHFRDVSSAQWRLQLLLQIYVGNAWSVF